MRSSPSSNRCNVTSTEGGSSQKRKTDSPSRTHFGQGDAVGPRTITSSKRTRSPQREEVKTSKFRTEAVELVLGKMQHAATSEYVHRYFGLANQSVGARTQAGACPDSTRSLEAGPPIDAALHQRVSKGSSISTLDRNEAAPNAGGVPPYERRAPCKPFFPTQSPKRPIFHLASKGEPSDSAVDLGHSSHSVNEDSSVLKVTRRQTPHPLDFACHKSRKTVAQPSRVPKRKRSTNNSLAAARRRPQQPLPALSHIELESLSQFAHLRTNEGVG